MKVSGPGSSKSTGSVKKTGATKRADGASGKAFSDTLSQVSGVSGASDVDQAQAVQAPQSVEALLALQEANPDDPQTQRQRAVQWGTEVLDTLEQLRMDLLMGRVPEARLRRILGLIRTQQEVASDPALKSLLDDIEIRAAVEMAKLGQFA